MGETLEECVVREVYEEVGIKVHDLKYHGSQIWPFPNQLMVGFIAKAYDTEIMPDHSEIESAEWFSSLTPLHHSNSSATVQESPQKGT